MNIQILPYNFNRIGLFLFLLGVIGEISVGTYEGLTHPFDSNENGQNLTPDMVSYITEAISLIGIILYLISKEKVEDELVQKIRLEAMSISFLISVGVLLLLYVINYTSGGIAINTSYMFYLQLFLFLLIYRYKKQSFSL